MVEICFPFKNATINAPLKPKSLSLIFSLSASFLLLPTFTKYLNVKIIEIKDDKIRFSKRALDKDPLDWFKDNKKKVGDIITTRIHEVLKTGVKVTIDKDKKLIDEISSSEILKMIEDNIITEGMIPKINTCLDAVNNGVRGVVVEYYLSRISNI